jgi:hypothetical protein
MRFAKDLLVITACGMVVLSAFAAKRDSSAADSGAPATLAEEIRVRETAVWEAAKTKDIAAFQALVAEDARMIFTSGVKTRAEYIQSIAERDITRYALQDFQVFRPAPNTVFTIYTATISGVFGGKTVQAFTVREASVWVQRSGKWVAVLNQETPIQ